MKHLLLHDKATIVLAAAKNCRDAGYVVNAPSWEFGRVHGVYVVFFFVVAQIISCRKLRFQTSRRILPVGLSAAPLAARGGTEQPGRIGVTAVGHF